jgi:protein tyrosine phosphatase (PTP) superfamily phosphohydrolase (DUF442 family)
MTFRAVLISLIACVLGGSLTWLSAAALREPSLRPIPPSSHLHNAYHVTDKVISGAQPDDDAAFASLALLGVKTIISVDGAKPNVEAARKHGMRYVHMPIGYDKITPTDGQALAKAITELPGPIYLHCHHGKHRSAAAVAVACVYNATLDPAQSELVLKTFGTGANYKGLWQSAKDARPLDPAILRDLKIEYRERADIGDLAEAMVGADSHFDHLKQIQQSGWTTPSDHPDLDPAHEALLVQEHLAEAARLRSVTTRPSGFRQLLTQSEAQVTQLTAVLQATPIEKNLADRRFVGATESCNTCHAQYRD